MIINKIISNNASILLRIWCGIIFIYYGRSFLHPYQVQSFAEWLREMKIPYPVISAYLAKGVEFIGGFFLIIGFLTRPICFLLAINMCVATFIANKGDLFNNAQGSFLLLLIMLTLLLSEQNTLSVDNYLHVQLIKKNK